MRMKLEDDSKAITVKHENDLTINHNGQLVIGGALSLNCIVGLILLLGALFWGAAKICATLTHRPLAFAGVVAITLALGSLLLSFRSTVILDNRSRKAIKEFRSVILPFSFARIRFYSSITDLTAVCCSCWYNDEFGQDVFTVELSGVTNFDKILCFKREVAREIAQQIAGYLFKQVVYDGNGWDSDPASK